MRATPAPIPHAGNAPGGARPPRRSSRTAALAATLVAALALALTACGGDDAMSVADGGMIEPGFAPMPPDVAVSEDLAVQERAAAEAPMAGGTTGVMPSGDGTTAATARDGRQVVRNAYLVLEVLDGAAAIDEIVTIAGEVDGYVASTMLARDDAGVVSGTVVVKVPSTRLDEVVERFDALAVAVPVRSVDEYDVTSQMTDLDAQLKNLRAFEEELRALLTEVRETGGGADALVNVLDRLRQVRAEIEGLEAWRAQLADQVAMSMVTVEVRPSVSGTPIGPARWAPSETVRRAASATLRALTGLVDAVIWFVVTVLPVLVVVGAVGFVLVRGRRAWRTRRSRTTAGGGPGA